VWLLSLDDDELLAARIEAGLGQRSPHNILLAASGLLPLLQRAQSLGMGEDKDKGQGQGEDKGVDKGQGEDKGKGKGKDRAKG
jgi:hypothetical protein